MSNIDYISKKIQSLSDIHIYGSVRALQGLLITVDFKVNILGLGSRCIIEKQNKETLLAEVVGFSQDVVMMMPFGNLMGVKPGCKVYFLSEKPTVSPHASWLGRVINALGEPIDEKGPLIPGEVEYPLHGTPLVSHKRLLISDVLDVGVCAINTFLTFCKGQRMGIFAGSGVGKSSLMSMLTRYTDCDICIIGLVGERGREVKEFINHSLGPEGLKRSILVVATSDEPSLTRREAAYMTLTLAEYFRDQGLSVLCLLDSITRFAMAQREIGLSSGEPPTTKGYTPTVFSELPKLLERASPGITDNAKGEGYITGVFTVLVDGGDHDEPIADATRGILDGHIVLDRFLAERGHFPSINILRSISRMVPACHTEEQKEIIRKARLVLSVYDDMADMIRLGAYKKGSDPAVDRAMILYPKIQKVLEQKMDAKISLKDSFLALETTLKEVKNLIID